MKNENKLEIFLKKINKNKHVVRTKSVSSIQEYIKTYMAVTRQHFTYIDKLRNYKYGFKINCQF